MEPSRADDPADRWPRALLRRYKRRLAWQTQIPALELTGTAARTAAGGCLSFQDLSARLAAPLNGGDAPGLA